MDKTEIEKLVAQLQLQPHPEGGFFRETYRSTEVIPNSQLGSNYDGDRNVSTAIYFLLTSDNFSAFHRINQDEFWHFYTGSPIVLHVIDLAGNHTKTVIGIDLENGQVPQAVVKGGCWFAAHVLEPDNFSLLGCTVAPGFDFRDFILADRKELISAYPQHEELIAAFTRS